MLKRLCIRNLSVVEEADLEFGPGLNVITGSTGAGKSLIVGAVNLLLGEKASPDQVRAGAAHAEVRAVFAVPEGTSTFSEFEAGGEIELAREVRAEGRSQAHAGGRAVTVKELHRVARELVEPHGQNEQYRLRDPESHVAYIDAFAENTTERAAYREALGRFRAAESALAEFERRMASAKERAELLAHRVSEIDRVRPEKGERESLETSLRVLENAERIHAALDFACQALYDNDESALSTIAQAKRKVSDVAAVDGKLAGYAADLDGAAIALRECVDAMRDYVEGMEFDPDSLRAMQERLDVLIGLERRYAMPLDDLIERAAEWKGELDGVAFEDEKRAKLRADVDAAAGSVSNAAKALSQSRQQAAKALDPKMTRELQTLMMKGAAFRTDIETAFDATSRVTVEGKGVALFEHGIDVVRLRVRTNPGEPEGGVDRIASTGEASRIALALKRLTQAGAHGSVMIFDEIDAGVGADMGDVIAQKLLELSADYQIVCITHMPQIAARGARHLVVSKHSTKGRTRVEVAPVAGEARRGEIARMLGGTDGSDRRLALAEELLEKRPDRVRP